MFTLSQQSEEYFLWSGASFFFLGIFRILFSIPHFTWYVWHLFISIWSLIFTLDWIWTVYFSEFQSSCWSFLKHHLCNIKCTALTLIKNMVIKQNHSAFSLTLMLEKEKQNWTDTKAKLCGFKACVRISYVSSSMYLSRVRAFLWSSSRNWDRYVLRRDRPGFSMNTWWTQTRSLIKVEVFLVLTTIMMST